MIIADWEAFCSNIRKQTPEEDLSQADLQKKGNSMVVAISVAVALIPLGVPSFYSHFPQWVQLIGNSGITIGSIMAIVLNVLLCERKPKQSESEHEAAFDL